MGMQTKRGTVSNLVRLADEDGSGMIEWRESAYAHGQLGRADWTIELPGRFPATHAVENLRFTLVARMRTRGMTRPRTVRIFTGPRQVRAYLRASAWRGKAEGVMA